MRVLLAFDKFKGSLSAPQACKLAARVLRERHRDWRFDLCPITDGGEGFAEILTKAAAGRRATVKVAGPRGGLVDAPLGVVPLNRVPASARTLLTVGAASSPAPGSGTTAAVIEMAAASGLALLPPEQHDPWQTTTYGTGQLIRSAAEMGAAAILLGVGGSATNDLGLGALSALGFEFRDADGGKIRPPFPVTWERINAIEGEIFASIPPISIACDVTNPLLGPQGATAVYGPQKGLRPADRPRLESAMKRIASMLCAYCSRPADLMEAPGAGAAGGIGFGLMAAARARLVPGFDLVSAWLDLEARIADADVVITGEGRFDASSLSGKGPGAVAGRAAALGKIVHIFAGQIGENLPHDRWRLHAITPDNWPIERALRETPDLLRRSVETVF